MVSSNTMSQLKLLAMARDDVHTRNAGIELGVWVSLGYILQALGLLTSDAGRASFITMFTVIVVPLIDGMLGSAIPARTWFGALMSIVGVAMLESSGSPPFAYALLPFYQLFGTLLKACSVVVSKYQTHFLDMVNSFRCISKHFLDTSTLYWDFLNWPLLIRRGMKFCSCQGVSSMYMKMAAMRDVSATETAIISTVGKPVMGCAGFAWFLLGEMMGIRGWIGAALVLDNRNGFSTSPVVVNNGKDSSDLIKK
ncbi:UNVERIFIED_CONTAM: hypothetical protein Sangu_0151200 [Sesamum angustifolium]|uniref:EamA domain-containing protein n=1 Tax=Sesamum angustifolium TaxID=2727405 RepID=A0AAW2RLA4_9LAMI